MLRCLIISFRLICLLYLQHQGVSKTELLCARYCLWVFLFSFSVYSIMNIRQWVKLNYCVHVSVFDFFLFSAFSVYSIINISRWVMRVSMKCPTPPILGRVEICQNSCVKAPPLGGRVITKPVDSLPQRWHTTQVCCWQQLRKTNLPSESSFKANCRPASNLLCPRGGAFDTRSNQTSIKSSP